MQRKAVILFFGVWLALNGRWRATAVDHPVTGAVDEQTLKNAGLAVDGPSLLEVFRMRTLTEAGQQRIEALVKQLGDNSYKARVKASTDLVALGAVAVPFLRQGIQHPGLEGSRRGEE